MINRNKAEELSQCIFLWLKYLPVHQTEPIGDRSVHAVQYIVKVGMNGVNGNIIFNGGDNGLLYIILPGDLSQPAKNNGMMCYDKVTILFDRFKNHFFGCIKRCN